MPGSATSPQPVQIFWCDLDRENAALLALDAQHQIAAPSERRRSQALSAPKHADRYLGGHIALRLALAQAGALSPLNAEYHRLASGKPSVPGTPVQFSYAASSNLAVIALHSELQLGIDIETQAPRHFRDPELDAMAARLPLIGAGANELLSPPPGQIGWMLLEALTKLRGERLAENLSRARPAADSIARHLPSISAVRFALPSGHVGVCCAGGRAAEFQIRPLAITV